MQICLCVIDKWVNLFRFWDLLSAGQTRLIFCANAALETEAKQPLQSKYMYKHQTAKAHYS